MTPGLRVPTLIAVALMTVGLLAACDPVLPHRSAAPTVHLPVVETASPAAPAIDFISVTAHDVSVADMTERRIATFPYTMDLAAAATGLGAAIGIAPTVTPVAATSCDPATAIYTWPGFRMYAKPAGVTFAGNFIVNVTAAQTSHNIGLVGPHNQGVGDTLAHVQAAIPGVTFGAVGDGSTQAILDSQGANIWGVIMTFNVAGTATDMSSPGFYLSGYGSCGT